MQNSNTTETPSAPDGCGSLDAAAGSASPCHFFVKCEDNMIPYKIYADHWSVDSRGLRFWRGNGKDHEREDVAWFTSFSWFQRWDARQPNTKFG